MHSYQRYHRDGWQLLFSAEPRHQIMQLDTMTCDDATREFSGEIDYHLSAEFKFRDSSTPVIKTVLTSAIPI